MTIYIPLPKSARPSTSTSFSPAFNAFKVTSAEFELDWSDNNKNRCEFVRERDHNMVLNLLRERVTKRVINEAERDKFKVTDSKNAFKYECKLLTLHNFAAWLLL